MPSFHAIRLKKKNSWVTPPQSDKAICQSLTFIAKSEYSHILLKIKNNIIKYYELQNYNSLFETCR